MELKAVKNYTWYNGTTNISIIKEAPILPIMWWPSEIQLQRVLEIYIKQPTMRCITKMK